jgi:hypothetical protein
MALRDQLRRLKRDVQEDAVLIRLRDGSTRVFTVMDVQKEMFLAKCDLACEEARHSPVLEAVRAATPESRAAFEAQFRTITPELHIVASSEQGGWVEVLKLEEDGKVTKVRHEGARKRPNVSERRPRRRTRILGT